MKAYSLSKTFTKVIIGFISLVFCAYAGIYIYQNRLSADSTNACGSSENIGSAMINFPDVSDGKGSVTFTYPSDLRSKAVDYKINATHGSETKTIASGTIPSNEASTTVDISLSDPSISSVYTITVIATEKGCTPTTLATKNIQALNCSLFPTPHITIPSVGTLKPGQTFTVTVQDPQGFKGQSANVHISVSDSEGKFWPRSLADNGLVYDTKLWEFNVSADTLGWHTIKVDVAGEVRGEDICPIGNTQANFCVSNTANCDGTPPTITQDSNSNGNNSNGGTSSTNNSNYVEKKISTDDVPTGSLEDYFQKLINVLPEILALLSFASLITSGYIYLTAGPNEATAAKGKNGIIYSVLGIFIASLAYVIVRVAGNLVK